MKVATSQSAESLFEAQNYSWHLVVFAVIVDRSSSEDKCCLNFAKLSSSHRVMASQNAIDFFATVGRKAEPLKCTTFPLSLNEDDPPLSAREVWEEAITDVVLLGNGMRQHASPRIAFQI